MFMRKLTVNPLYSYRYDGVNRKEYREKSDIARSVWTYIPEPMANADRTTAQIGRTGRSGKRTRTFITAATVQMRTALPMTRATIGRITMVYSPTTDAATPYDARSHGNSGEPRNSVV